MRNSNMNISVWRKWAVVWMVAVLSGFQLRAADPVVVPANMEPLTIEGNRFVTLCIMIRTTPWEVSRDVKLHPRDEVDWHTLEGVRALREAFATNNPNGRLTWGFTMNALEDGRKNYREIRDYVVECQKKYGDEVTYFPGYFHGLKLQLKDRKGEIIDEVSSYFGMRSVSMGKVDGVLRPLLNGEFVFHIGLLDQGYWPDGAFTAPTDKALLYDIELAKRAGFNVIRKHIKVEPQRWYYHCDRLGLMVWQDMPNLWEPDGEDSVAVRKQFRDELKVMIDQHVSSPSIVMWVPFNENWGAFEATDITAWVKKYDPNRWVNGMSGYNYAPGYRKAYGDPRNGDFVDMHHYGKIEPKAIPRPDDKRAASLGEFGGKGLFVRGHMWPVRNDAYEMMLNREVLTDTYVLMLTELEQMINYFGLSTAIYTQTTDVEHEINGLVTYDRKVEKMDLEKVKYINQEVIRCTRKK